jgi:hypothetical protein
MIIPRGPHWYPFSPLSPLPVRPKENKVIVDPIVFNLLNFSLHRLAPALTVAKHCLELFPGTWRH